MIGLYTISVFKRERDILYSNVVLWKQSYEIARKQTHYFILSITLCLCKDSLVSTYNLCIHDIANFVLFFQYFQATWFTYEIFQIVANL